MTGLVSRLRAPGLFAAEIWDAGQAVAVHPEEEAYVARAGEKRRRDFALGRACARAALAGLGVGAAAIARGEDGAPRWPAGVVGSITHTAGYAAALVGDSGRFARVGIDAEQADGVTADLWPRLFTDAERRHLKAQSDPVLAATLFFSAKEASYKAWALKGPLAFREIEITSEDGGFVAARMGACLRGCHAMEKGVVLTAAWCGV